MAELKEVFEMVTKQTEPDLDSWKHQEERQRRAARNRKLGAVALVAAVVVGLTVFAVVRAPNNGAPPLGSDSSSTSAPPVSGAPPIGAEIIGLDGSVLQSLPEVPFRSYGFQRSPAGTTIAFIHGDYGSDVRIATIDPGNGGVVDLTGPLKNAGGDAQEAVSWSPDGTQIAYAANDCIYVMDADGSNVRRLTTRFGGDYHPAWSSTGVIAYWHGARTGEDGGPTDSEIYTIPASGGTPTRLTHNGVSDIEPAWSPEGSRIAYWHGGELWVMQADGTRQHRVYSGGGSAWAPAWSPDGRRIAFLSYDGSEESVTGGPLLKVLVLTLASGQVRDLGVRVETDLNGPSWVSNSELLINRYD